MVYIYINIHSIHNTTHAVHTLDSLHSISPPHQVRLVMLALISLQTLQIWKGKLIELSELLPSMLYAQGITLRELMASRDKPKEPKKITTTHHVVVCFNATFL